MLILNRIVRDNLIEKPETHTALVRSPYADLTISAIARAATLQDFNPRSKTYGCCDRNYWQYKTITGFPAATFQQLALPFALLYSVPFEGNVYHQDEAMLERALAAVRFWCTAQHRGGALDEWYRHEYSYCATAFTTFGMAECLLLLGDSKGRGDFDQIEGALFRAADWLSRRFNSEVMNQNLAACAALWNVYRLSSQVRWKDAFTKKWTQTLQYFHPEGWFREYGGADLGYATLALDLLACLDRRECEEPVLDVATKSCQYLASFISATGGLAPRLGSRGTQHAFPFGFEVFAARIPEAEQLAAHLRRGLAEGRLHSPLSVDDRYLAYFYLPQFGLACTAAGSPLSAPELSDEDHVWDESGFRVWRRNFGSVVCSLRRKGAFNLHAPGKPVHCNMGYWIEAANGRRWSSAYWNSDPVNVDDSEQSTCRVHGRFCVVNDSLPLARGSALFHLLTDWFFRIPWLGEWSHGIIKQRKIIRARVGPLTFERLLQWSENELRIIDTITTLSGCPSLRAVTPIDDIDVHSPSGRLGTSGMTVRITAEGQASRRWAELLNETGSLKLETIYAPDANGRLDFASIAELSTRGAP